MSNCNCNNNSNNCCRPTQGCKPQNPCQGSCNTNTPVGFPCGYRPIKDPSEVCCKGSIRAALQAIRDAVFSANIPGFGVNIIVTTTNGVQYPIFISASTAIPLVLTKEILIYGTLVIDLDSISRIQIESGALANPAFTNRLLAALRAITSCANPGCGYSPLAVTEEDNDDDDNCDITLTRGYCNNCNRPIHQCCCKPCVPNNPNNSGIQDFINRNPNNIGTIEFEGGTEVIQIPVASTFSSVTVVAPSTIVSPTLSFVTDITPGTGLGTTVVAAIGEVPVTIANGLTVTSATLDIAGSLTVGTGTALATVGATITPISVVGGITGITPVTITPFEALLIDLPIGVTIVDTTSIGIFIPEGSILTITILPGTVIVIPPFDIEIPLSISLPGVGLLPLDVSSGTVPVLSGPATITSLIGTTGTPTIASVLSTADVTTLPVVTTITAATLGAATTIVTDVTFAEVAGFLPTTVVNTTVASLSDIVITTLAATSLVTDVFATTQALSAVGLTSIAVISPIPDIITGNVVAVGAGLVVIQELDGDITIYSVCKIDAVSSRI